MYAIDPTPGQLKGMYHRAARAAWPAARRPLEDLMAVAGPRLAGVLRFPVVADHGAAFWIGVCWWTDRLGRRHWEMHGWDGTAPEPFEPPPAGVVDLYWLEDRHPLEWIVEPLSCGWRERGGRREFVVVCRCGVAGTPDEVGWMGRACGPCFDREQEGGAGAQDPPRQRAATRPLPTDVGPLAVVTLSGARAGPFHDDRVTTLTVYDPWDGPSSWDWEGHGHREVATRGALIAVGAEAGEVTLLDARSGTTLRTFHAGRDLRSLAFAGPATLVTMHADRLIYWDARPGAALPARQVRMRHWAGRGLFSDRPGARLAAVADTCIEVREVETGRLLERLAVTPRLGAGAGLWGEDGSVFAAWAADQGYRLGRWAPAGPPLPGLFPRLMRGARAPDATAAVGGPAFGLTPCGRFVVTADGERVTLRDRDSLEARAAFAPSGRPRLHAFAFAPDGRLLAGTGAGLAAWPWPELFGEG